VPLRSPVADQAVKLPFLQSGVDLRVFSAQAREFSVHVQRLPECATAEQNGAPTLGVICAPRILIRLCKVFGKVHASAKAFAGLLPGQLHAEFASRDLQR